MAVVRQKVSHALKSLPFVYALADKPLRVGGILREELT